MKTAVVITTISPGIAVHTSPSAVENAGKRSRLPAAHELVESSRNPFADEPTPYRRMSPAVGSAHAFGTASRSCLADGESARCAYAWSSTTTLGDIMLPLRSRKLVPPTEDGGDMEPGKRRTERLPECSAPT
jgi:hypothetical protein